MIRRLKGDTSKHREMTTRFRQLVTLAFASNKRAWRVVFLIYLILSLWLICVTLLTIPILIPLTFIMLCLIPILILYLRWKQIQHELSQEIYIVIPLLASQYRMNGQDLIRALQFSVQSIKHEQLQQVFIKMVHALQLNLPQKQFRELVQGFILSLKHAYTLRLFVLIQKAYYDQANIAQALAQLAEDVQQRKKDLEAEISQTQDTRLMGLLPLITLPLSIYFTYHISSLLDYTYLFMLPLNLLIFCLALLFSILSILLSFLLKQPQTDY